MSQEGVLSVEDYLEKILEELDFSSLNDFLYGHLRTQMSFEELVSLVSTQGLEAINAQNICEFFHDCFLYEISIARPIFIKMLCFCVLFAILHKFLSGKNKYISDIGFLSIYSTLMVLLMQSFSLVKEVAMAGIDNLLTFLNALIPAYAVTMVFSGNTFSGAFVYEMAFFMVYGVEIIMRQLLSPMIHIFILMLFLNQLFEDDKLSKLCLFFERGVNLILKTAFGGIIGLSVVQSMINPAKDRLTESVLLSGLSAIPGIGNAIGGTGEILLSCGLLIKNSVGVIGLVILAFLTIIPMLKISCFWLMYHCLSILLQPIADKRITECVFGMVRGCDLYFKIVMYTMLLFFVLFSMIGGATSFVH